MFPGIHKAIGYCFIPVLALFCLAGCSDSEPAAGNEVVVQLDWFPEPEHGGLYQALAKGYFQEADLEVTIRSGGNGVASIPLVASGRAHVGTAPSNQTILAIAEGNPVCIVGSVFHEAPTVLMVHEDNPVRELPQLDGRRIMAQPSALFIPYLKKHFGITFDVVPQTYGLGPLINDPDLIQQGFYIAEFYHLKKAGVTPRALRLADAGYVNSQMLVASRDFMESNTHVAQAFLAAYQRGWQDYLENDPAPAHALIREASAQLGREVTDTFLSYVRDRIIEDRLAVKEGVEVGAICLSNLALQIEQLEELGELEPGEVEVEEVVSVRREQLATHL